MQKRIIHIHSKCDAFEIFEIVDEKDAVKRLTKLKETFIYCQEREMNAEQKRARRKYRGLFLREHKDHLVVKTRVVNPELPFGGYIK